MRLVTFQSRDVTNELLSKGRVETTVKLGNNLPLGIRPSNDNFIFIQLDNEILKFSKDMKELYYTINKSSKKDRILPFYAYHKHYFCGELRNMSIGTIYNLSSHFIGACGYDGRDIIELEVPEDTVLLTRELSDCIECLLPYITKDWVVSILKFRDYITEPVHGELALAYTNEVYNSETYRMCYSNSVVINGHGRGDKLECCQSPALLNKVAETSIQRDYVQPGLWALFCKFAYVIRHGMSCDDIQEVKGKFARIEMPENFDIGLIPAFNVWVSNLCRQTGTAIYDTQLKYTERLKLLGVNSSNEIDDCKPDIYRVITFQSKEVVDIVRRGDIYYADRNKMREGSICQEDIETCGGCIPVWVFQHPAFKTTNIGPGQWSEMLQTFRCEMSIDTLDNLYMIELLLPYQPPVGKAHNGTSIACIIPSIIPDYVKGIYKIQETEDWYFYGVEPVSIYSNDVLFPKKHIFTKEEYKADDSVRIHLMDYASVEDYYKGE